MKRMCFWAALFLCVMLFVACGDDDDDDSSTPADDDDSVDDDSTDDDDVTDDDSSDDDDDTTDDDDDGPPDPISPSVGFLSRQAQYLDYCSTDAGPGQGDIYNQVCVAYTGNTPYDEQALRVRIDGLNNRQGSCDFHLNALLRILYFDRENPTLPGDLRDDLVEAVLNFKYWLDEPGDDDLQWWSENHQILYHAAEILAGQLFPDEVFPNSGMTGADHVAHAVPLAKKWIEYRGWQGFGEWNSNVYFNEDMPALINLAEFAEDGEIAVKAAMIMDQISFNFAINYYKGLYATTHGRTYKDKLLGGLSDSTSEPVYILLGLGAPDSIDQFSDHNFTACILATSEEYFPPALLEDIAEDAAQSMEHKQRDGIDLAEGPTYGIGYGDTNLDDVMYWWGHTGYSAPEVIGGTFEFIEHYDMWDGNTWSDIAFLRPLVGSPLLPFIAGLVEPVSRGPALEAVNTYTWRTPDYQLSGAQDYKPGFWTGQNHIWKATIDQQSYVFTTYPGGLEDDYMGGDWTGGWTPRATLHENVAVIQYRRPNILLLDSLLFVDYSHAYFPKNSFDEWTQTGNWTLGKKGDVYLALYSETTPEWSDDNDYELIANSRENVWILEMGDSDTYGDFATFTTAIESASITIGETVIYDSPSQGEVEVGYTGPMTIQGQPTDIGPYGRWQNKYADQTFGANVTVIEFNGAKLKLDFETGERLFWAEAN